MSEQAQIDLRYIRAKLPSANERQLSIIASFVRALQIIGWSDAEFYRDL